MLASNCLAQPVSDSVLVVERVASFESAVSLGATTGAVFVVDAGPATVSRLDLTNGDVQVFAGSGGSGRLLDPHDVDPTNGLNILVSDRSAARVMRLSRDLALVEVVDLGASAFDLGPGSDGIAVAGPIEPSHVAGIDGATFALIDARRLRVLRWTRERGVDRAFGLSEGFSDGPTQPQDPVDLIADARRVFVADRHTGCLFEYDTMGSYVRRSACSEGETVLSVARGAGRIWITRRLGAATGAYSVIEAWSADANRLLLRVWAPPGLDVISAVGVEGTIWLLTATGLFRNVGRLPHP